MPKISKPDIVAEDFLGGYFKDKMDAIIAEQFPKEMLFDKNNPADAQMMADFIANNSEEIYEKLMEDLPEFEEGATKEKIDEIGKRANPNYHPLSDEEVKDRKELTEETVYAMCEYFARHTMAITAASFGGRPLTRTEQCLLDFSGTPESFQRNIEIRDKLHGTSEERLEIMAQRMGEIISAPLEDIDLTDDSMFPHNFRALEPFWGTSTEFINILGEMDNLGAEYGTREEFNELCAQFSCVANIVDIGRLKSHIISSPTYHQLNMDDIALDDFGGIKIDGQEESVTFGEMVGFHDRLISAPVMQGYNLKVQTEGVAGASVFMDKSLTPEERRNKFFEEFDVTKTEYGRKLKPYITEEVDAEIDKEIEEEERLEHEASDLVADVMGLSEPKPEPQKEIPPEHPVSRYDINAKTSAPAEMQEMKPFTEDGKVDERRAALERHINGLKMVSPSFKMSEDEINEMLSPERIALHDRAAAVVNRLNLSPKNYTNGIEFPGNTYSVANFMLDRSGTPEAEEYNKKVCRAFDNSHENYDDKAEIFADAMNRMMALDVNEVLPPKSIEDRVNYAIEHAEDFIIAFGFRRGLASEDMMKTLGVTPSSPEMAKLISDVGEYAEAIGGTGKALLRFAASEGFLSVPLDKVPYEDFLKLPENNEALKFIKYSEVEGLVTYQGPIADYPDVLGTEVSSAAAESPFTAREKSYGAISLNNLSDFREKLEIMADEFDAAGEKNKDSTGKFKDANEKLKEFNAALKAADNGGIILPESVAELQKKAAAFSIAITDYKRAAKAAGISDETRVTGDKLQELIADFGTRESAFKSRIARINEVRENESNKDELIRNIDALASLKLNYNSNSPQTEEIIEDYLQWNLNPAGNKGTDYKKMKDFSDALISWRIENTIALGEEAMYLKKEMGIDDDKAAAFAFNYSLAGKKADGMNQALIFFENDADFARMKEIFGIKTGETNIFHYIEDRVRIGIEERIKSLEGEEKEALLLGRKALDSDNKSISSIKEGKFITEYAEEQESIWLEERPSEISLPNSRDFRNRVKAIAEMGNELVGIDKTFHINSKTFRKLKNAIEALNEASEEMQSAESQKDITPEMRKNACKAIEDIKQYAEQYVTTKWKDRTSDIGKDRIKKAWELLDTVDDDRAYIARKKVNANRALRGLDEIEFEHPDPIDTFNYEIPEEKAGKFYDSPAERVERITNSLYVANLDKMVSKKAVLRDDMNRDLAGLMVKGMLDKDPSLNTAYDDKAYMRKIQEISEKKEFMNLTKDINADNLADYMKPSRIEKLALDYAKAINPAVKQDNLQNDLTRKRSNTIAHEHEENGTRSRSNTVVKPKTNGNPQAGGLGF